MLVFGTGISGIGAARLLLEAGAHPWFYDGNEKTDPAAVRARTGADVPVVLGNLPEEKLKETALAVLSPGVPCDIPDVLRIRQAGVPVWGEVELAYRTGRGRLLAITGTNGKTTTTALLGHIMREAADEVYVVGNIGSPYTAVSLTQTEKAVTVAEISSFQLETIEAFHPEVSSITNITEDHLNRHHTMEEYIRVKERIAENQTEQDTCVLNYEDPELRRFGAGIRPRVVWFSSERALPEGLYLQDDVIWTASGGSRRALVRTADLQLIGRHNYENVMTAAAMALAAGVPAETVGRAACTFAGVAHRIEFVEEIRGVRYYNDSKGTNPDAAIKAVEAMNRPTLLIGGGYDKQSSYDTWIESFRGRIRYLALIGKTREKILAAAVRNGFPRENCGLYDSLEEAVKDCARRAEAGQSVLLSPACASWDQFQNYEQRGDLFKQYVRALPKD